MAEMAELEDARNVCRSSGMIAYFAREGSSPSLCPNKGGNMINFRAWHKYDRRMVYSFQSIRTILIKELNGSNEVYRLMQYVGKKDSEGTEIFEKDVVETSEGVFLVEWKQDICAFAFCSREKNFREFITDDILKNANVLGNVFENPELRNRIVKN